MFRQGDVLLVPVKKAKGVPIQAQEGRLVLARGEATGHHHSIALSDRVAMFREDGSGGGLFLAVTGAPVALEHQEHGAIALPPGAYRVSIQRVYQSGTVAPVRD